MSCQYPLHRVCAVRASEELKAQVEEGNVETLDMCPDQIDKLLESLDRNVNARGVTHLQPACSVRVMGCEQREKSRTSAKFSMSSAKCSTNSAKSSTKMRWTTTVMTQWRSAAMKHKTGLPMSAEGEEREVFFFTQTNPPHSTHKKSEEKRREEMRL